VIVDAFNPFVNTTTRTHPVNITFLLIFWCRQRDLNPQPIAYKAIALPLCYDGEKSLLAFLSALSESDVMRADYLLRPCITNMED
jgi:hypothetical protein